MTVALFCGSRNWTDPEPVRNELLKLESDDIIIHGDQVGADLIADFEARKIGIPVLSDPADWELGSIAGPIRNERMLQKLILAAKTLKQPVKVVAFHEDIKLGSGTRDMVQRAMRQKIRTYVYLSQTPELVRVGTYMDCEECKIPYLRHPPIISELSFTGEPFLNWACDGRALKL